MAFPYGVFMSRRGLFRFREYHYEIVGTKEGLTGRECTLKLRNTEFDKSTDKCSWIDPDRIDRILLRRMSNGRDIRYPGNWDGQKFCNLVQSIKENGMLEPITVYCSNGKRDRYVVIRGCHRAVCCMYLGLKVPAHILEPC